jgi:hypothetical protein
VDASLNANVVCVKAIDRVIVNIDSKIIIFCLAFTIYSFRMFELLTVYFLSVNRDAVNH